MPFRLEYEELRRSLISVPLSGVFLRPTVCVTVPERSEWDAKRFFPNGAGGWDETMLFDGTHFKLRKVLDCPPLHLPWGSARVVSEAQRVEGRAHAVPTGSSPTTPVPTVFVGDRVNHCRMGISYFTKGTESCSFGRCVGRILHDC